MFSEVRQGSSVVHVLLRDLVGDVHVVLCAFDVEVDVRFPLIFPGGHRSMGQLYPVGRPPLRIFAARDTAAGGPRTSICFAESSSAAVAT